MERDATAAFARALVDEWARAGVTDACLAPGSRSAPLALALAADPRLAVHVMLDERSASFFALGLARATGRPVVVGCTSGTAAANLHPAVLEAHHGRVPLVVCTADRPPELHDVGAGQTVDQTALFGATLRWSRHVEPPEDRPGAGAWWRHLAARSVAAATGPPAGPVHLNLAFREPLVPTGAPVVDAPGRSDGRPWVRTRVGAAVPDAATVDALAVAVRAAPRGLLVAGWGADMPPEAAWAFTAAAGWPVLADPVSGVRVGPHAVSTYDALLAPGSPWREHDASRPDLVVRVGGPLTSRAATDWLDADLPTWLVDPYDVWADPASGCVERVVADPALLLGAVAERLGVPPTRSPWLDEWLDAERRARHALDAYCESLEEPFEGRVARDVVAVVPDGTTVAVAASMPMRDVESFAAPRDGVRFVANRGVNGIDGFVSTVLGAAVGTPGAVVALMGDLCFLHDANGLLGAAGRGLDVVLVVLDNGGGGIFSFLPQAELTEHFDELFATPQAVDVAAVARVHGLEVAEVRRHDGVGPALTAALVAGGVRVLRVRTDRARNVARHREARAAVAAALRV